MMRMKQAMRMQLRRVQKVEKMWMGPRLRR
jgi:hypothetical protein